MSEKTISEQLEEVFHRASMTYVGNMLKSERDLAEIEAINQDASEKQVELTRLYHEQYDARVDAARQRLYDQSAQLHFAHPAPSGSSTNSDDAIVRQAHHEVELAHEADLRTVRDEAQRSFEDLLDRAHRRNQTKGVAAEDFLRAQDRRSGHDRRTLNQSRE